MELEAREHEASDTKRAGSPARGGLGWLSLAAATAALLWPAIASAGPVVFQAAGQTPVDIVAAVEDFRNFLGANHGVGGTFPGGRREINWDAVPDALSAPHDLPANFFNANSPRGAVFFTPGAGFQVSGKPGVAPIEFDNLRRDASRKFAPFSPPRLFTALASPVTEVVFFLPGTAQAATSKGFGVVFTGVGRDDSTKIEYYDVHGALLFSAFVPPAEGDETLSFLGVGFDSGEEVFLVRITSGDVLLGEDTPHGGRDLVVMDDFIYGEPQALP